MREKLFEAPCDDETNSVNISLNVKGFCESRRGRFFIYSLEPLIKTQFGIKCTFYSAPEKEP